MDKEETKDYYSKISEMGKYLEQEGMPLAYHHHMGTVIESQEETIRLLENTHDSVKLTLDTGHMLFANGDSINILKNLMKIRDSIQHELSIVISMHMLRYLKVKVLKKWKKIMAHRGISFP